MITSKKIEKESWKLVHDYNIGSKKVDVKNIARELNLELIEHDLGKNVSGMLVIKKGRGIIGYNPSESPVRQRFTISHEIGHYILHRYNNDMFIDQTRYKAFFRSNDPELGNVQQEREANRFAASLLMPRPYIEDAMNNFAFDLADDKEDSVKELASQFGVSTQAMAYRISNLGLFL